MNRVVIVVTPVSLISNSVSQSVAKVNTWYIISYGNIFVCFSNSM